MFFSYTKKYMFFSYTKNMIENKPPGVEDR